MNWSDSEMDWPDREMHARRYETERSFRDVVAASHEGKHFQRNETVSIRERANSACYVSNPSSETER